MSSRLPFALIALSACCALPAAADTGVVQQARVSYDSGGVMLKGDADAEWSYAKLNTLVLPGDAIWVDEGHMAEFEFQDGVFLRAADGAKLEIRSLPPGASFRGWQGPFYLQRTRASRGSCLFETPVGTLNVAPDTLARVDILANGATTVSVRWGRVTVHGDDGSPVTLDRGYRSFIDPGYLPSPPAHFDLNEEDEFDAWNRDRTRLLAVGADVPMRTKADVIGVHDLRAYGDWVHVGGRQYWRPVAVADYVPYRSGYWNYVPSYGYTWVGSYPFSYATSHYGRWTYHSSHGWLWYYTGTWAPAHCAAIRYGDQFIWTPLDPWDKPVYIRGSASFVVDGVRYSLTASSYSYADALLYGPAPVYGVRPAHVSNIVADQVNIWNIYAPNHSNLRPDYGRGGALARDYNPRRVIRGPETALASAGSSVSQRARAVDRVASVSRTLQRQSFQPSVSRSRSIRTSMSENARTARVRPASVRRSAGDSVAGASSVRSRSVTTLTGNDVRLDTPNLHRRSSSAEAEARSRSVRSGSGSRESATARTASAERAERPQTAPRPPEGPSAGGAGVAPPRSRASVRSASPTAGSSRSASSRPTATVNRERASSVRSGDRASASEPRSMTARPTVTTPTRDRSAARGRVTTRPGRPSTTQDRASSGIRPTDRPSVTVTSPRAGRAETAAPSRVRPTYPSASSRDRSTSSRSSVSRLPGARTSPSRTQAPSSRVSTPRTAPSRSSASSGSSPRSAPSRPSIFGRSSGASSPRAASSSPSSSSSRGRSSLFDRSRGSSGPARPATVPSSPSRSDRSSRVSRPSSSTRAPSMKRGGGASRSSSRGSRRGR